MAMAMRSGLVITVLLVLSGRMHAQHSTLAYPGTDGRLVYVRHANTQETDSVNTIPDFSVCGYKGGGVPLPVGTVPVKIILSPQAGNDRKRIQDAINYVSGLTPDANGFRGAVLLTKGTYEVNDGTIPADGNALLISKSGVVLRGEGQGPDGTILLSDAKIAHTLLCIQPPVSPSISRSNITRITDAYVGTGAMSFNVASSSGYSVGDAIYVTVTPNTTWLTDIYANNYIDPPPTDIPWDIATYTVSFERNITAISGNTITINSPIVQPMQAKYGGGEISLIRITGGERLYNIGVEDLRLIGADESISSETSSSRLQFAIRPRHIENGWIHGVSALHASESTVKTWSCRYFTVEECAYLDPLGPKEGGWRYAFGLDAGSNHVLFQRNFSYDGRHDYVSHARMPGPNAFLDCVSMLGTTIGPHERWAMGTLFDNLKMQSLLAVSEHRGNSGTGHSWAGAQQVAWNTESSTIVCDAPRGHQNYAIGCIGTEVLSGFVNSTNPGVYRGYYDKHGTHVATRSLYLKQLEDRLGSAAVANVTIPEQRTGSIYDLLTRWAGDGPLTEISSSPFDKAHHHIFIGIGQSNMAGRGAIEPQDTGAAWHVFLLNSSDAWEPARNPLNRYSNCPDNIAVPGLGPLWEFAKRMTTADPSMTIGLVANARGGTSISQWKPGAADDYFGKTIQRIRAAKATGTIKGILWHQGESDRNAVDYPEQLATLIQAFRDTLKKDGVDTLFFIAGQLCQQREINATFNTNLTSRLPGLSPLTKVVSSDGCSIIPGDSSHFDAAGLRLLGKRYGDTTLTFYSIPADVAPPVISNVSSSGITASAAVIKWTTDEVSSSVVEYGPTTSYGNSKTDAGLVTSHSVVLSDLTAGTVYHYRVKSVDASNNAATSSDYTFQTISGNVYSCNPSSDAYIRGGSYAGTNYGSSTTLDIKQGSDVNNMRKGLVKFDLSARSFGGIILAQVRLYASSVSASTPITLFQIDDDRWNADSVTWNNAPSFGSALSTVSVTAASKWYEFDVTSYVQAQLAGDKIISLGIWDANKTNTNVSLMSTDAAANKPELVVLLPAVTGVITTPDQIPKRFGIQQNFPNPFNPSTTITYQLPESGHVTLEVHDILGRTVLTLVDGVMPAGYYTAVFNGSNLSSGVYYARLSAQTQNRKGEVQTLKLLLVK